MFTTRPEFDVVKNLDGSVKMLDGLPAIRARGDLRFVDTDGTERVVPASFESNAGSTPTSLRWFLHPHARKALRAFHLHDFDYSDPTVSRRDADRRFFYTLRCDDVPLTVAFLAWLGVRIGGGSHRVCEGQTEISLNGAIRAACAFIPEEPL